MIVYLSFSVPYAVWLLVGFFPNSSNGIEEAKIDGANKFVTFYKVVLPIVHQGLLPLAIYTLSMHGMNPFMH